MGKIIFRISKTGDTITAEGEGFGGKKCVELSDKFLEKLGVITSRKLKQEFYELETEKEFVNESE
jgi:hypothetical protein